VASIRTICMALREIGALTVAAASMWLGIFSIVLPFVRGAMSSQINWKASRGDCWLAEDGGQNKKELILRQARTQIAAYL